MFEQIWEIQISQLYVFQPLETPTARVPLNKAMVVSEYKIKLRLSRFEQILLFKYMSFSPLRRPEEPSYLQDGSLQIFEVY
jgi:hypothetical protein